MAGVDGRAELIEYTLVHHEAGKRLLHPFAARMDSRPLRQICHVMAILVDRHRRSTDVVDLLQKDCGPRSAGIGNAISIRWAAERGASDDFALSLLFEALERGLQHSERYAETLAELGAGQLSGEE